jgi:hypothetical protein
MRVARYRGEKNLQQLATRLYRLDASGAPPAEAAPALAEANQQLPLGSRSLAKEIPAGTLLAVPELDGAFDGRSSVPRTLLAAQVLRIRALDVLARAAADAEDGDAREAADIDALTTTIESEEFAELAKSSEALAATAASIHESIGERRAQLATVKESRARALADARVRLDELAGRHAGASGRG